MIFEISDFRNRLDYTVRICFLHDISAMTLYSSSGNIKFFGY